MTEYTSYIETEQEKIANMSIDERENFILLTDHKTVIANTHSIRIDLEAAFPIIRSIHSGTFLIADSRTETQENVHIYRFTGQKIRSFHAGDGISDIVVHSNKIVIAYFDEGIFGAEGPNKDGIAVFDFLGNQLFGFNSNGSYRQIEDCYCLCRHSGNTVLFYAYPDFNVCELNLDTFHVSVYQTPGDFSGATSLSSKREKIYFHSNRNNIQSFFLWNRDKNEVTNLGRYNANLTGIGDGKFLTYAENRYTIIDPTDEIPAE